MVWAPITSGSLAQLRELNAALFPVAYDAAFYRGVLAAPLGYVRGGFVGGRLVAAVCCRLEGGDALPRGAAWGAGSGGLLGSRGRGRGDGNSNSRVAEASDNGGGGGGAPGTASPTRIYIMTLGVAAAYRERGLGSALIRHVMGLAAAHGGVSEVYLHVHVPNVEAIRLYSRHGFEIASRLKGYYRRIEPPDCYYVRYLL